MVVIEITSAGIQTQKNYDLDMTVATLKQKLEIIVGAAPQFQKLQLLDPETEAVLADDLEDDKTLAQCGVQEKLRIHVIDTNKNSAALFDDPTIEKYTMSEEAYDARDNTFRKWKERNLPKKPAAPEEEQPSHIQVGMRCEVQSLKELKPRGTVKFVGKVTGKEGYHVGIFLDEPVGNCDGTIGKTRLFQCPAKCGLYVKPKDILVGDYPELGFEDEIDEI